MVPAIAMLWPAAKASAFIRAAWPLIAPQAQKRLEDWRRHHHFKLAVFRAFNSFSKDPAASEVGPVFFDEWFLTNVAAPLLARFVNERGRRTKPEELAGDWLKRYRMPASELPKVTIAAARFLELLEDELLKDDVFDALMRDRDIHEMADDARAMKQAAQAAEQQARTNMNMEALDLLFAAARDYRRAARSRSQRDPNSDDIEIQAEYYLDTALSHFRALSIVDPGEVQRRFNSLVVGRYVALCEALERGGSGDSEHAALEQGVNDLKMWLRDIRPSQ
jgi:hypothetical protein